MTACEPLERGGKLELSRAVTNRYHSFQRLVCALSLGEKFGSVITDRRR